jgi:hypothetical protein
MRTWFMDFSHDGPEGLGVNVIDGWVSDLFSNEARLAIKYPEEFVRFWQELDLGEVAVADP